MQDLLLIPFADYWWAYIGIIGAILAVSIIVSLAWNRLRLGEEGKAG